jgi:protein-S-isoprenylcysteine O-methyltransferase Ste14
MTSAVTAGRILPLLLALMFAVWIGSEFVGAMLVPYLRGGGGPVARRSDRGSGAVILGGMFAGIVAISVFANLGYATFPLPIVYLGIVFMAVGIAVRQWAIATLGRFFSTHLRVVEGHRIVDVGLYRYVRHPSYTGALIIMLGVGLAGGSWEGLAVVLGGSQPSFTGTVFTSRRSSWLVGLGLTTGPTKVGRNA